MSELSELSCYDVEVPVADITLTLDALQGWWENASVRTGMVLVRQDAVFIRSKKKGGPIQVSSNGVVTWGQYSGIVKSNGKKISWRPGNITWMYIGTLPDEYNAETHQGRWRYDAFLGKGSSGCVFAVEEARKLHESDGRTSLDGGKFAVKVLRSFCDYTKTRNHQDVFKLHREFQWSHLRLHNQSHEQYDCERARLIVEYLEDHTGFQPGETMTAFTPEVAAWLASARNLPPQPYVVMELDGGIIMWDVLSKREQQLSSEEKGKIIEQTAMALDYMGKFNLTHRDLRLHNICVSGYGNDCRIKVLDLGRVMDRNMPDLFAFTPRDEAHWILRDWIPWEEWVIEGKPTKEKRRLTSAFDIFSMGVILLYLCVGQAEARHILDSCRKGKHHLTRERARKMILDADFVLRMVNKDPIERPTPLEVMNAFASKRRKLN